jgi:hypothetical protein
MFQGNEDSKDSFVPTADEDLITGNDDVTSSHDKFDISYVVACDTLLPIEHNPDFINLGARLELGEDSDSDLTYDSNDDDMYGPAGPNSYFLDNEDGEMGAPFSFPGFQSPVLPDNARNIPPSPLQPADESLLALVIENNLPQDMYNKILDWALFAEITSYQIPDAPVFRTALRHMHAKYASVCGGPPKSEVVTVPGYQPMHVYRFDFLQQAKRLFLDDDLMKDSLWHYNPKVTAGGERLYSEMNTGDFWKLGADYVAQLAGGANSDNSLDHLFCPVILFVDATLADRIGRLKVEPVLCSVGNICGEKRRLASSWFILGFIPPYPKSSIEVAFDRTKVDSKHGQITYYHECLKSILQDLLSVDKNEHGHEMFVAGKGFIRAHFKLSLVIGDTEGHDKICTHYLSYSSNIQRVSRDCNLPQSQADDVNANCQFVIMEEIKTIVMEQIDVLNARPRRNIGAARAKLQEISQYPVLSAFFDFDYCGDPHGIFGSCPFERLHAWLSGIMRDGMRYLFLMCDLPQDFMDWCQDEDRMESNRPHISITDADYHINKAKFEAIFRFLTMCSRRQSDHSVPRTPFKNGVTDLTRLNGQEYPGLVMLTLVALKGLLHERVDESWHEDIVSVLWMMLSLNEQMSSPCISSSELEVLENRINIFLHKYKLVFGHVALANSKVGLKKVKFHAPKHFVFYNKRYGSSENSFGGTLESALKSTVKQPTERTSRRHDHLCKELAARQHDRFCIAQSRIENSSLYDNLESRTSPDSKRQHLECDDNHSMATTLPSGWRMHKSVFSLSRSGEQWSTHHGKNTFLNRIVYPNFVSSTPGEVFGNGESLWVVRAVEHADELGYTRIKVCCGASIPTERVERSGQPLTNDLFRCHPSFHSYPFLRWSWHDWAMIRWSNNADELVHTVAARLLMFAKLSGHNDPATRPRVVAVVQSLSQLNPQPDSLLTFALGYIIDRNPVLVDVEAIASTAFVLPCVQNPHDQFPVDIDEANYFLVMPPRVDWKNIGWDFSNIRLLLVLR